MKQSCHSCKYWWPTEICRLNPPVVVLDYTHEVNDCTAGVYKSAWPETSEKDWCGKWEEDK